MTSRTSESHRGAGSLPVPTTPLSTQTGDVELVLHDGPEIRNDTVGMNVVSNADVGEEQLPIGPIGSVLIRERGTNQAINAQPAGLTLTQLAPPWPNVDATADLPARHGNAEQVT